MIEDLRQYCLFLTARQDPDALVDSKSRLGKKFAHHPKILYFEYVKLIHQVCRDRLTEECSREVMNSLKIDWDVNRKCVADSFVSDGQTESTNY